MPTKGLPFVLLWQGFALAVSGVTRLWRFMKADPKAAETEA